MITSFLSPVVFLNFSVPFIAETLLKQAGSLFSRMSLDLHGGSSWLDSGYEFLQDYFRGDAVPFSGF